MQFSSATLTARDKRGRTRHVARLIAVLGLATAAASALAQGGPPMVTDDPETPGDGHWEINIGAIATHMPGRWEIAAPDLDINYGWGDRVQLKLDVPWVYARDDGQQWKAGVGVGDVGVKWRFIDQEQAGFSLSTYPQYGRSMLKSSTRRGITGAGQQFFLPLEMSTEVGGIGIATEVGRSFGSGGAPDQWVAGVVAAHACGAGRECMVEVHHTRATGDHQTLLNFGMHWKFSESYTLLAAAGRDFGTHSDEHRQLLVYLGVQVTR